MSGRDSQPTVKANENQTLVEKLRSRADRWQPWIDDDLEAEFGYRPEHMRFHQALDRQAADEIAGQELRLNVYRQWLVDRVAWLKREMDHGGDWHYLNLKREETAYCLKKFDELVPALLQTQEPK